MNRLSSKRFYKNEYGFNKKGKSILPVNSEEFSLRGVSQAVEPRGSAVPAGTDSDPAKEDSSDFFIKAIYNNLQ